MQIGLGMALVVAVLALACASLVVVECGPAKGQQSSNQASARLMKDLQEVYKSDSYKRGVFEIELVDDNIYEWNVKFNIMDDKLPLYQDLKRLKASGKGEDHIMLRISFGQDYPVAPPFVRVVYPVLSMGYMQPGGAICMSLITKSGWNSGYTSEALILAVAQHIIEGGGRTNQAGGIMDLWQAHKEYTDENARDSFKRVVQWHDWDRPQPQQQQPRKAHKPTQRPGKSKPTQQGHTILQHTIEIDLGRALMSLFG